jgi:hypothetical protein
MQAQARAQMSAQGQMLEQTQAQLRAQTRALAGINEQLQQQTQVAQHLRYQVQASASQLAAANARTQTLERRLEQAQKQKPIKPTLQVGEQGSQTQMPIPDPNVPSLVTKNTKATQTETTKTHSKFAQTGPQATSGLPSQAGSRSVGTQAGRIFVPRPPNLPWDVIRNIARYLLDGAHSNSYLRSRNSLRRLALMSRASWLDLQWHARAFDLSRWILNDSLYRHTYVPDLLDGVQDRVMGSVPPTPILALPGDLRARVLRLVIQQFRYEPENLVRTQNLRNAIPPLLRGLASLTPALASQVIEHGIRYSLDRVTNPNPILFRALLANPAHPRISRTIPTLPHRLQVVLLRLLLTSRRRWATPADERVLRQAIVNLPDGVDDDLKTAARQIR